MAGAISVYRTEFEKRSARMGLNATHLERLGGVHSHYARRRGGSERSGMLYSVGKDSAVMLPLAGAGRDFEI